MSLVPKHWPRLALLAASTLLALGMHAPLLASPGSIPGEPGSDALRGLWSIWLVGQTWITWPLGTNAAGFPAGVNLLPFPAASLTFMSLTTRLLGPITSLRLLVLGHTSLALLSTAWLVRTLKGGWGMALLAGTLVASQPLLGGALRDGTLEVLAIAWLPAVLAATVKATRGERPWGAIAGALFVMTCLESAYYASFAALGVLLVLSTLRTKAGLRQLLFSGLSVGLGLAALTALLWPIIGSMAERMGDGANAGNLQAANAADWQVMLELARTPGARGCTVSDLWAPPWPHWLLLGVGALAALRRHAWLSVLALLALVLALHHPWLQWWAEGPIGSVVRFPRRYIALVVVASAVGLAGLAPLLKRVPMVEMGLGLGLSLWVGYWGAAAGGQLTAYPLLDLPQLELVEQLSADPERAAVLLLPTQIPTEPNQGNTRGQDQPVFADLSPDIAGAERLLIPTLANKRSAQAPSLLTLKRRDGPALHLAKNLSDLCFSHYGMSVPAGARAPAQAYTEELAYLKGQGLKYVVVDPGAYEPAELELLRAVLEPASLSTTTLQDGSGVLLFQLYEQRPAPRALSSSSSQATGLVFSGVVIGGEHLHTDVHLLVQGSERAHKCMVTPQSGTFDCGTVDQVGSVTLYAEGEIVPTSREGGYSNARILVLEAAP